MSDGAALGRRPECAAELGANDLDLVLRREEPRQQISSTRRVVGEVEGEDRDFQVGCRSELTAQTYAAQRGFYRASC
jgi:hypothetical protein